MNFPFSFLLTVSDGIKSLDRQIVEQLKTIPAGEYAVTVSKQQRSSQQNRAMHKFFVLIAEAFNEQGIRFKYWTPNENMFDIPYSPEIVKDFLWRPVQKKYTGKTSTAKLTTEEVGKVVDVILIALAKYDIYLEFPSDA